LSVLEVAGGVNMRAAAGHLECGKDLLSGLNPSSYGE
jgi:hypothetical protein